MTIQFMINGFEGTKFKEVLVENICNQYMRDTG